MPKTSLVVDTFRYGYFWVCLFYFCFCNISLHIWFSFFNMVTHSKNPDFISQKEKMFYCSSGYSIKGRVLSNVLVYFRFWEPYFDKWIIYEHIGQCGTVRFLKHNKGKLHPVQYLGVCVYRYASLSGQFNFSGPQMALKRDNPPFLL